MALFGVVLFGVVLSQLLPWIGTLLFWAALPLITLGFMRATLMTTQGEVPTPGLFVTSARSPASRALWQLGIGYALAMVLITLVYGWIDGGSALALQKEATSGNATPESLSVLMSDASLQTGMLWFAGAVSLLSVPYWHAPALVYWGGQPAGKALFFSTVACWRNKGAFFVYALTIVGLMVAFTFGSTLLFSAFGQPQMAALALMPALLMFSAIFYASLFFTFSDCFEATAPTTASLTAPPTASPD